MPDISSRRGSARGARSSRKGNPISAQREEETESGSAALSSCRVWLFQQLARLPIAQSRADAAQPLQHFPEPGLKYVLRGIHRSLQSQGRSFPPPVGAHAQSSRLTRVSPSVPPLKQ